MSAAVVVIKLALGNRVIDINARAEEFLLILKLVKSHNTSGGLFRDTLEILDKLLKSIGAHLLNGVVDNSPEGLFLRDAEAHRVDQLTSLLIDNLSFSTLHQEHGGISSIIHDHMRSTSIGPD